MNVFEKERTRHHISVRVAHEGILIALRTQPNFAYHAFFSLTSVLFGVFFQITRYEWLIICVTIIMGFVIEMANTSIEYVVDLATKKWHKDAKQAKDIAAGMMMIFAYGSVLIAVIIYTPYFLSLVRWPK